MADGGGAFLFSAPLHSSSSPMSREGRETWFAAVVGGSSATTIRSASSPLPTQKRVSPSPPHGPVLYPLPSPLLSLFQVSMFLFSFFPSLRLMIPVSPSPPLSASSSAS